MTPRADHVDRPAGAASPRRVRLPELGAVERARLWLSYQRYAFLLIGAPVAGVAGLAAVASAWWWAPAAVIAIAPVRFGAIVWARWPRKLRATQVADARIRAGRFAPRTIRTYCGDPCYRVVAGELLRRAGVPRRERRRIVSQYREELRRDRSTLVIVDHLAGTVTTIERT